MVGGNIFQALYVCAAEPSFRAHRVWELSGTCLYNVVYIEENGRLSSSYKHRSHAKSRSLIVVWKVSLVSWMLDLWAEEQRQPSSFFIYSLDPKLLQLYSRKSPEAMEWVDNPGTRLRNKTKDAEVREHWDTLDEGRQRRDIYREKESLKRSGTGNSGLCIQSGELRLCPIRRGRLMGSSSHFWFSAEGRFLWGTFHGSHREHDWWKDVNRHSTGTWSLLMIQW